VIKFLLKFLKVFDSYQVCNMLVLLFNVQSNPFRLWKILWGIEM
jgi:hypothetical protein